MAGYGLTIQPDRDEVQAVLAQLSASDSQSLNEQADELLALSAIFDLPSSTEPPLSVYHPPRDKRSSYPPPSWTLSSSHGHLDLVLSTTISEAVPYPLHLLLSLPADYPLDQPPQLQIHDRFLGPHAVTSQLFARVLRTFMHDPEAHEGVVWNPGEVCLYEGVEYAKTCCEEWITEVEAQKQKDQVLRGGAGVYKIDADALLAPASRTPQNAEEETEEDEVDYFAHDYKPEEYKPPTRAKGEAVQVCPAIISSEPVVDRKSVFIGHVASVTSPEEVQLVISTLLEDRRIAKASHNISAYRLTTADGVVHQDNDDDGESAAGSRLAHLMSLLDVMNVVVVVSRWFGGIHLGADRFKHINAAARDALQLGGHLEPPVTGTDAKGRKVGSKKK